MADNLNSPEWRDTDNLSTSKQTKIMYDVTKGTLHIQSQKEKYLPRYYQESNVDYDARVANSELLPATTEAIQTVVGKVLSKPTVFNDVSDSFDKDNIDGMGADFESFEADALNRGVRDGMDFILVDFEATEGRTRQQEVSDNLKPYYKIILSTQVLNKRTEIVNGKTVLTQVTIYESIQEPDGEFGMTDVDQYRVFKKEDGNVTVRLYRKETGKGITLVEGSERTISTTEIPLVPLYTNKTGYFVAEPLFQEMAQINLSVYRMNSGLKRTITNVGDPTHVIYGQAPSDEQGNPLPIVVGSSNMLNLGSDDKYEIVGVNPESIQPTKDEIATMKEDMANIATEITSTDADRTATEINKDDANQKSKLTKIAIGLENCWNTCKDFYFEYLGEVDNGTIKVNRDFNNVMMTPDEIKELRADYLAGIITKETYIEERQKGETLTTIDDIEAEISQAENDLDNSLDGVVKADA